MKPSWFVGKAKRQKKCRCCEGIISKGQLHFSFIYRDNLWLKHLNLCGFCLWKILEEVKI